MAYNRDGNPPRKGQYATAVLESGSFASTTPYEYENKTTEYDVFKTPADPDGYWDFQGALREGDVPTLWSRECFGLYAQYAAVGLIYGTLPSVVYPFLSCYLNMEGTQTASARVLVSFPWSFKVLYGIISDCVPICGYRRRPYMLIGWSLTFVMLLWMAVSDVGKPYYPDPKYRDMTQDEITAEMEATFNHDATSKGGFFTILMMFAAVGYVCADVAADAVLVELAQREPEAIRGRTQSVIYFIRTIFMIISNLLMMFFFNGKDYGGEYDFGLSFPMLMLALAIFLVPVIPMTWTFIPEAKTVGVRFSDYLAELWELMKKRAMYQIIAYKFIAHVFDNAITVATDPVSNYWIHVSNFNNNLSTVLSNGFLAVGIFITGKWGLNWSWRSMSAWTMILLCFCDGVASFLGVWDIVRTEWFWLGGPVLETLPYGVNFIIGSYVVVELAGIGNEGAVYGLVTTVSNLAQPFSSTISKNVDSLFDVTNKDIKKDDYHVRMEVTWTLIFMYAAKLGSLLFLPLLPRQRIDTQRLMLLGGKSKAMGLFTICYCVFALIWSIMTNILSIFPDTKCLRIAGGRGCQKK